MLSRSLRPLTARATSLTANPIRSRILLGPFCIRTFADAADGTADGTAPAPATIPTPPETSAPGQLPYFASRNTLGNFGVYLKSKRGGNLKLTLLKHCAGDLGALTQDITTALKLAQGDVYINSLTKHVVIKGHKRDEIVTFLQTLGF